MKRRPDERGPRRRPVIPGEAGGAKPVALTARDTRHALPGAGEDRPVVAPPPSPSPPPSPVRPDATGPADRAERPDRTDRHGLRAVGGTGTGGRTGTGPRGARSKGPSTGPGNGPGNGPHSSGGAAAEILRARLRERTADLQRVKAEYDNYRKRVRRDHQAVREVAVANVLTGLLPVLDALDAARAQGAASEGDLLLARALEERLAALGLTSLGEPGDPFDPSVHEALDHVRSDTVTGPTCVAVHRPGYRVGRHLLRPAEVTVAEPRTP